MASPQNANAPPSFMNAPICTLSMADERVAQPEWERETIAPEL